MVRAIPPDRSGRRVASVNEHVEALAALSDLLLGRNVKRGRHELPEDLVQSFEELAVRLGFQRMAIAEIPVDVGTRVGAWCFRPPVLQFGMVFWEVFTVRSKRKLFASELRNERGDWVVQIPASSKETLLVNLDLTETYDASRPVGIY